MNFSRRDFLKLTSRGLLGLSGLLSLGGLLRYLSYQPDPPPPQRFEVGEKDFYALKSRTTLPTIPAVLIRSGETFQAIGLTCPHLGCTVEVKAEGFVCPCHGSRYDSLGNLLKGPAQKGLPALRVEIEAGKVIIYKG